MAAIEELLKYVVKKTLAHKSWLYQQLKKLYYRLGVAWRPIYISNLDEILGRYAERKKNNVFFVNIGANDGIVEDPIAKYVKMYRWEGLMVEPVSYLFERLKQNYSTYPILFENSAVATQSGKQKFYYLRASEKLPDYHQRIGSLDKTFLLVHGAEIPHLEEHLIEEEINCLSFDDLKKKYNLSQVQLLLIDTEGKDAEILQSIDLKALNTEIVIFEHIGMRFTTYKKVLLFLKRQGFRAYRVGRDTIGVQRALHLI